MAATSVVGDNALFGLDYLMRLLRVAVLLSIWRILLTGKGAVSGMNLASVLTYTLVSEAFAEPLMCRTWLESSFWDGSIAMRFLKPIGVFAQFAVEMMGRWTIGLVCFSLPLMLCAPLLGVNPLPAGPPAGVLFIVSLILAISVGLALEYIFAATAVGVGLHPYAMNSARAAVGTVLSGALLPLALLPWHLGSVFAWLPFASMASAPLRIYTGTGDAFRLLAIQIGWTAVLWPTAIFLWKRCRERMTAYGG